MTNKQINKKLIKIQNLIDELREQVEIECGNANSKRYYSLIELYEELNIDVIDLKEILK